MLILNISNSVLAFHFTQSSIHARISTHLLIAFTLFLAVTTVTVNAENSAIASAHPLATQAGLEILEQGGNAFDAAVAVSAALAVVEPTGSGLGGGGFWLLHRARDGFETMIDGREKAPLAASKSMFINSKGQVDKQLSRSSALSAGIPGTPAAIVHIAEQYGRLPLSETLKPAIRYAQQGFVTNDRHQSMLNRRLKLLQSNAEASAIFLQDRQLPKANLLLIQTDLAITLTAIAEHGKPGFYSGQVAQKLVTGTRLAGGIWTLKDLADYHIVERRPIYGNYHGIKITSAAPPSSGGIVLIATLNILEGYPLDKVDAIIRKHLIVEAMRRAYRDRALYLGDPDFIEIPTEKLLNKYYAAGHRTSIRLDQALSSNHLAEVVTAVEGGTDTSHFSIIDSEGNRVAATLSINFPFGSGIVAPGTGVLLNNEMDDFVSQVGALNGYGLIGGSANAIVPGKRMLSSMTPTFLEDQNRIAILGTPGGSRIISMVLLAALDFAEGNDPESWVSLPRFHHQYIPDEIQYEPGTLSSNEILLLQQLGHKLNEKKYRYGNMQAIMKNKLSNTYHAASDARGEGLAVIQ